MGEIFRPRKSDRIFPWVLSFISTLLAVFIMVRLENLPAVGFVPVFFFPFFFLVIGILIGKSYIKVSDDGLSGRVMLMEFQTRWNEIIAGRAVHYESRPNNILFFLIKTSDKKITIPLRMFDGRPIWDAILRKAPKISKDESL